VQCLENVPEMGITSDINCVINVWNCDHLHENVRWICENFPVIRHFVWNNMDPDGNRAEENPDCIPRHYEFQVSLEKAMDYLVSTGRSFRAERVPLCYMRRYAWASTEARKIIKEEERCIRFLDYKGFIHQKEFLHGKGDACDSCRFDPICAGMFSMAKSYDERELSPIFDDPTSVIAQVLRREPSPELVSRLMARRGRPYADYDADRVLADYPEFDAILKYPGERFFAEPEYLATLADARVVLRDAEGRGADPLEPFYFLDGIDVRNFDRFLERCFGD